METETIDKLFLELSQVTKAKSAKELSLEASLQTEAERRVAAVNNLTTLCLWLQGDGEGWPLSGIAWEIRQIIEQERINTTRALVWFHEVVKDDVNNAPDFVIEAVCKAEAHYEILDPKWK